MKRIYFFYTIIISLLFTISCEREVTDVDLPNEDPKLVVYSYISPTSKLINVLVSKSVPFFGPSSRNIDNTPIKDAVVLISSGTGLVAQISYSPNLNLYSMPNDANFPIVAGQTYLLEVSTPDGFRCTAKTTVPANTPDQLIVKKDSTTTNGLGFRVINYQLDIQWADIVNVSNYYTVNVQKLESFYVVNNMDTIYNYNNVCYQVLNDNGIDGSLFNYKCNEYQLFETLGLDSINPLFRDRKVSLLTTDISYYKYHESLLRYNDDIPFSEPVQVYSNIEGGLGCFGSYLQQDVAF